MPTTLQRDCRTTNTDPPCNVNLDDFMKITRRLICAALLLQVPLAYGATACEGIISNRTGSEDPNNFVAGSYLVLFNDPAIGVERVVLPPDPALRGTVPFGEAANGQ